MNKCSICEKEITEGVYVTTGLGNAHQLCYYEKFAPKECETFQDVLVNSDDQVIVRQLLDRYVPDHIKQQITDHFNKEMKSRHENRIQRLKEES